ncbi:helix-turn-helix domain-containing protein [Flammeovirga aprica]|uniref:Helix-turn-helix transcriptional regulator n=1 Tax=Flammeovirga aprica JL-4 TaxID=694437 RepID=A0A7X9P242_9BACT|nr:AraC family transcriptional regulator [Flammeovirga aprica]NME68020.1 helix-turn-helix transcriptional regulator [Flammeovirga aprica JL-4]
MYNKEKEIRFKVKEGDIRNYIDSFLEHLGGTLKGNHYILDNSKGKIDWLLYEFIPGFQLVIGDVYMKQSTVVERELEANTDHLHIGIFKSGVIHHQFEDDSEVLGPQESKDIFISNGLFPIEAHLPSYQYSAVGIKIKRGTFSQLLPHSDALLEELFPSNTPMRYHLKKNNEVEMLMDEIFHSMTLKDWKNPLVMAKGLEIFTFVIQSIQVSKGSDELYGLHIEDYNRLIEIKEKLLSNFEQKVVLEELATEFGISVSKLKRDFKILFNTSVYQYFMNAKMDEAYKRLQSGKYSVSEIAYDLGYKNLATFSRMFKKVKGLSPTDVAVIK